MTTKTIPKPGLGEYNPVYIESKWQKIWTDQNAFGISLNDNASESIKNFYYVLEMFPYPSGKIHMGHLRNYALGDVIARLKKTQGYQVLHPMGWDAFGLPAENAAIENNSLPQDWTYKNIDDMRKSIQLIGCSYDWNREFATCDEDYYAIEQQFFLEFYKHGLAYKKESIVNWDPVDQTVLANEQVVDGKGWRSGAEVEKKNLSQWFLKVSKFAPTLLEDLDILKKWPNKVMSMQKKWIGKSYGCQIHFELFSKNSDIMQTLIEESSEYKLIQKDSKLYLEIYTTRPETLFGASFCAIACDHPIVFALIQEDIELKRFCDDMSKLDKHTTEKHGYKLGISIIHPFTQKKIDVYVANFILSDYGTGAIFGCPGHDERDFEFATKYGCDILNVIDNNNKMMNSSFLDGLSINDAFDKVIYNLGEDAKKTENYRIRDWGISRQRYWGCPIPIIYCPECGTVPSKLPLLLPTDPELTGRGNPLENHPSWKYTSCPNCGIDAIRETDTFDTFFESSWYFIRFLIDKKSDITVQDFQDISKYLPVHDYIGGVEHAILHLLYARFFTKALQYCGYFNDTVKEPFERLTTQGMVCHEVYKNEDGKYLFPEEVDFSDKQNPKHRDSKSKITILPSQKMSKSKKNVVDPTRIIEKYGADTARLFMLSDSPPEKDLEWSDNGIMASHKYLEKFWNFAILVNTKKQVQNISEVTKKDSDEYKNLVRELHKTIYNVTKNYENFAMNKAIANIREFNNILFRYKYPEELYDIIQTVIILFFPIIPHMSEELWNIFGNNTALSLNTDVIWPQYDQKYLEANEFTFGVQVNGKMRKHLTVSVDTEQKIIEDKAIQLVDSYIENKEIVKIIFVPKKLVNIVCKDK